MGRLGIAYLNVGKSELTTAYFADFCSDKFVYALGEPHLRDGMPDEVAGRIRICSDRGARVAAFVSEKQAG
jgi:hypothetical protein